MASPIFRKNAAFNTTQNGAQPVSVTPQYDASGQPERTMTYEHTAQKVAFTFGILVVTAVVGWLMPGLAIIGALVGFTLAMVNIFKKQPSPVLISLYAAAEGLFLGGVSGWFEGVYPGIVSQAVLGTLLVVGVTLGLFADKRIRATPKATRIFMIAMFSYLIYSLVNAALSLTGVISGPFGMGSSPTLFGIPLGIITGLLAVVLGSYSLVLDFDSIQRGVDNRADKKYEWTSAFGIMVTIVWLYTEMLRLIALARN